MNKQGSLFVRIYRYLCFVCAGLLAMFAMALTGGKLHAQEVDAQSVFPLESELLLSNPCVIFNEPTKNNITRITYGEDIDFSLKGNSQVIGAVQGRRRGC